MIKNQGAHALGQNVRDLQPNVKGHFFFGHG